MNLRYLLLISLLFTMVAANAQNEVDALRYANFNPIGTARYTAMGGAFGALGGDLSATLDNPAGIGIYRSNDIGFTGSWQTYKSESSYYGSANKSNGLSFRVGNIGMVFSSVPANNSVWKYVNFGFSYHQLANFNRNIRISGNNNQSSILDGETDYLNSYPSDTLDNMYYLVDAIYWNGSRLMNDYELDPGINKFQDKVIRSKGKAGEYNIALGANINEVAFVGASIGIVEVKYEEASTYTEIPDNGIPLLFLESTDFFETRGTGFNFKVGAMFKVNNMLRLGMALHTPTIYNLEDRFWSNSFATIEYSDGIYDNEANAPEYFYGWHYNTPLKVMGSAAVVLAKYALISGEYQFADYSSMNMSADDYDFYTENNNIDQQYAGSHNFKLGAEFRFGMMSLRAGGSYQTSPFAVGEPNHDSNYFSVSGGIGLRASSFYFDAAYRYASQDQQYFIYGTNDSKADLTLGNQMILATVGFKF